MEKVHFSPCSLCNEQGHSHSKCPSLSSLLKMGFYTGGGGGGSHSHDDEEESKTQMQKQNKWLLPLENIFTCISRGPLL